MTAPDSSAGESLPLDSILLTESAEPSLAGKAESLRLGTFRTILHHREILVLLICCVLLGLSSSFYAPFMSMFGTLEAGMSSMVFGVFMTITSLSAIGLSTLLAHWSDTRFSRRAMLLLGSACGVLGFVGYAYVRQVFWLTLIGCIPVGISTIGFSQIFAHGRELLSRSGIPDREAPIYMNVFRLFFALAWTVGPALASWVIQAYSYKGTFLATALVFLLLMVAVLIWVPATPPSAPAEEEGRISFGQMMTRPDLVGYFMAFVLIFTSTTIAMLGVPLLVIKTLGGTERHVGVIFSLAPIFELPLMYVCGVLASRGDQARLIRIATMLAAVYFVLLFFVRAPWHIYPLQILSAAITAVISGVAITFFQNYMPGQAGAATNFYYNAFRVGQTSGYLLFGLIGMIIEGHGRRYLGSLVPSAVAHGYHTVFIICTVLCLGTLAILFWLRSRGRRLELERMETAN
jgi:SET family sugar efflux transporter-like MFS transporter